MANVQAYELYEDNLGRKIKDFKLTDRQLYQGIPKLKRADIKNAYTKEQIAEYKKCKRDPVYFLETYVKIVHIDHGVVPFKLYDYQKELIYKFQANRFVAALQCRQSGKSTVVGGFILWFILFHPNKEVAILANKGSQSKEILSRVIEMMRYVPVFLKPGMREYNKTSLTFDNGSKAFSAASSSDAVRGRSLALCYIDEAAFIPNEIEFYESTYPVISSGKNSRIIMTTTPRGARGLFFKIFTDAMSQKNNYVTHKVIWSDVPGRDEAWKEETIANTSQRQFSQEQNCDFLGSSNTLVDGQYLQTIPVMDPIETINDNLNIYLDYNEVAEIETYKETLDDGAEIQRVKRTTHVEKYENGEVMQRRYVATVDCAEGVGGDSSVCTVFDVTDARNYEVAAVYKDNTISPMFFPSIIKNMCERYGNCPVLVELNSVGSQVAHILYQELEYEEIIMVCTKDGKQRVGGVNPNPGLKTSKVTKQIGCTNLKTIVENNRLTLNDADAVDELQNFIILENGSFEADDGCHDDVVATLFIFAWLVMDPWFKDWLDQDIRSDMLKVNNNMLEEDLLPFGFIEDGVNEYYDFGDLDPLGANEQTVAAMRHDAYIDIM